MPIYFQTNSPATAADNNTVGTIAWSNVNNVFASDDSKATASVTPGAETHYIKTTNYGFKIPSNAKILGIVVSIETLGGIFGGQKGAECLKSRIVKGGTIGSTDNAVGTEWGILGDTIITMGGATNLWGETWTPADINGSTFGQALSATTTDDTVTASLDHIQITVYYEVKSKIKILD